MAATALGAMSFLSVAASRMHANSPKHGHQQPSPPTPPQQGIDGLVPASSTTSSSASSSAYPGAIAIKNSPTIPSPPSTTSSSPRSGPIDCSMPIPEEDEDETSSETIEPITPNSDTVNGLSDQLRTFEFPAKQTPKSNNPPTLNLHTATPPPPGASPRDVGSPAGGNSGFNSGASSGAATPVNGTPGLRRNPSSSGRRFNLFRREKSSHALSEKLHSAFGQPSLPRTGSDLSASGSSATFVNPLHSSDAGSMVEQQPAPPGMLSPRNRSSTGLMIGQKKINFASAKAPPRPPRKRSVSLSNLPQIAVNPAFTRIAESGAGLKARRMSQSLPDDFDVDEIELNHEFVSSSHIPGKRGKMVGSGATAIVKLMFKKGASHDIIYAVKEFRKRSSTEDEAEYVKKVKSEYSIAKSLKHPNIVETVRLCTHSGRWNHVMEYCSGGDLFSLVQKKYLKDEDKQCLFKQLIHGVLYLHQHGIAHRDIKLENLLVSSDSILKITDFGVSEVFSGEHPGLRGVGLQCGKNMGAIRRSAPGICGSAPYIAPEVLAKNGDYDPRPLDVWSCFIVYLTMFFCGSPWNRADDSEPHYVRYEQGWTTWNLRHPDVVIDGNMTDGFPNCGKLMSLVNPPALRRLLMRMGNPDPEKRATILDAANDRWLQKVDCCAEEKGACDEAGIDVNNAKSCRIARAAGINKKHNHLPPKRTMTFEV